MSVLLNMKFDYRRFDFISHNCYTKKSYVIFNYKRIYAKSKYNGMLTGIDLYFLDWMFKFSYSKGSIKSYIPFKIEKS